MKYRRKGARYDFFKTVWHETPFSPDEIRVLKEGMSDPLPSNSRQQRNYLIALVDDALRQNNHTTWPYAGTANLLTLLGKVYYLTHARAGDLFAYVAGIRAREQKRRSERTEESE